MEMFFANDIPIIIYTLALLGAVFILIMLYVLLFVEDVFDESDFVIDHEKKMLECENRMFKREIKRLNEVCESYINKDKVEYHDVLVEWGNDGLLIPNVKFINDECKLEFDFLIDTYTLRVSIKDKEVSIFTYGETIDLRHMNKIELVLH